MKKYSVVVLLAFIWAAYYYSLGISNKLIDPFATGVFIRLLTFLILTMVMGAKGRLKALRVPRALLPFFSFKEASSLTSGFCLERMIMNVRKKSLFAKAFPKFRWRLSPCCRCPRTRRHPSRRDRRAPCG